MIPSLEYIRETASLIEKYVNKTPVIRSLYLSSLSNAEVLMKLENMQVTGSFKARGAFSKILRNLEKARSNGVIAASTGNHGQAVAYASTTLGAKATIVMPTTAPQLKINRIRYFGGDVLLHGEIFDDAAKKAIELAKKENKVFVHPFDDPDVIAGQGTIGLEISEYHPDIVIVPVGGGGLISGIALAIKSISKNTKVIGVQSEKFPHAYANRKASRGEQIGSIGKYRGGFILADGIAVKEPGEITTRIIEEYVDDFVLVSDEEIFDAIYIASKRDKIIAEGAGAAPIAALLSGKIDVEGKRVMLIISGGNIDPPVLNEAIIRGLKKDERLFELKFRGPSEALKVLIEHHALMIDSCIRKLPGYGSLFSGYVALGSKEDFKSLIEDLKKHGCEIFE